MNQISGQNSKHLILSIVVMSISIGLMSCKPTETKPNILFIMSDDHAELAISCYGSKLIETPNIDRLAQEGIRFNNSFVTNSICAPSRAVLLTGKYSHMNGLRDNRDEFDGSQMTFPKLLQEAGYQTGIIGKWHLKTTPTGFDDWRILIGQGEYYNPSFNDNGEIIQYTGYTTDLITDMAIESLEKRNRDQPFCMLVHHKAPHRNWMPDIKYLDAYKDQDLPLPETFYDDYSTRSAAAKEADMRIDDMYLSLDMKLHPEYYSRETGTGGNANADSEGIEKAWQNVYESLTENQRKAWDSHYIPINEDFREKELSGKGLLEWKYQRYIKDYLQCILSVDESVGRLLDYLDEAGIAENTIVVYTSDQGFYLGEHGWYDKRFMYEESLSMPLLIRYPKEVESAQVSDKIVLNLDFAPTFLDYAGVPVPEQMQGKSLRALNRDANSPDWRTSMYYHYYEYPHGWHNVKRHNGIRTERYKLIHFYNDIDEWELFDLYNDPDELNNLYGKEEYVSIVDELKEQLEKLQVHYQDTI